MSEFSAVIDQTERITRPHAAHVMTALIAASGKRASRRCLEFFAANIRMGLLTRPPLPRANAHAMIGRRADAAGIATKLGNHSFRATGITAYLKNGGRLGKATQMANCATTRTTQLHDRRREELSLDQVERIRM